MVEETARNKQVSLFKLKNNLFNQTQKAKRKMTGLLTRHCQLNKHLNNLSLVEEAIYRFCQEEEEITEHIFVTARAKKD